MRAVLVMLALIAWTPEGVRVVWLEQGCLWRVRAGIATPLPDACGKGGTTTDPEGRGGDMYQVREGGAIVAKGVVPFVLVYLPLVEAP